MDNLNLNRHISQRFNAELESLLSKVMAMGGLVERQLEDGLLSLSELDEELGQQVMNSDYKINAMEIEIDEFCIQMLAQRTPVASDLRVILGSMKAIGDLERIGDQAEKLGHFSTILSQNHYSQDLLTGVQSLGDRVRPMLSGALDAYARMDVEKALKVAKKDRKINAEFDNVMRQLITHMMEDPRSIRPALQAQWCARSLERIANHTCNICEYIVYMVTAENVRHVSLDEVRKAFKRQKAAEAAE